MTITAVDPLRACFERVLVGTWDTLVCFDVARTCSLRQPGLQSRNHEMHFANRYCVRIDYVRVPIVFTRTLGKKGPRVANKVWVGSGTEVVEGHFESGRRAIGTGPPTTGLAREN